MVAGPPKQIYPTLLLFSIQSSPLLLQSRRIFLKPLKLILVSFTPKVDGKNNNKKKRIVLNVTLKKMYITNKEKKNVYILLDTTLKKNISSFWVSLV